MVSKDPKRNFRSIELNNIGLQPKIDHIERAQREICFDKWILRYRAGLARQKQMI